MKLDIRVTLTTKRHPPDPEPLEYREEPSIAEHSATQEDTEPHELRLGFAPPSEDHS